MCHRFGERGWCRATSGNFSLRLDDSSCLITQSGCEKARLLPDDLMICDLDGHAIESEGLPSAETELHTCIYRQDRSVGAVLHTHSSGSTKLSRHSGKLLSFSGYEMQKALTGTTSHDEEMTLVIFDNDQDISALARKVSAAWSNGDITVPGFLIAGHGLYAWGGDLREAERHVDGFEFLLECVWQEKLAQLS